MLKKNDMWFKLLSSGKWQAGELQEDSRWTDHIVLYDFIIGYGGGVDHLDIYRAYTDGMKFLAILWSDDPFHVFANLSSALKSCK